MENGLVMVPVFKLKLPYMDALLWINAGTLRKRNSWHLIKDNTNLTHCPCSNSWTVTKITRCDLYQDGSPQIRLQPGCMHMQEEADLLVWIKVTFLGCPRKW